MKILNVNRNWEEAVSVVREELIVSSNQIPLIGFCGGRSVKWCLKLLEDSRLKDSVEGFLVDERIVPLDHPDSNFKLLKEELDACNALGEFLKLVPFETNNLTNSIETYNSLYLKHGGKANIVFLGVGEDGHIASIFPGLENTHLVRDNFFVIDNSPKPPPKRMTASSKVIKDANLVVLFVLGETKRAAYLDLIDTNKEPFECPAKYALLSKHSIIVTDLD